MRKEQVPTRTCLMTAVVLSITVLSATTFAAAPGGEAIFKEKCAPCHPNGGNVMKANATLMGIKDPKRIITQIRKGGGSMPAFDAKAISDADATTLANYIIKKFKM